MSAARCEFCRSKDDVQVRRNMSICKDCFAKIRKFLWLVKPRAKCAVKAVRTKPRRGPMRDKEYRRWCSGNRCALCPCFTPHDNGGCVCSGPTDPAHTVNNGLSSKGSDSSCVPLCRKHHREFDSARNPAGVAAFEERHGVSMKILAAKYYAEYLKEKSVAA